MNYSNDWRATADPGAAQKGRAADETQTCLHSSPLALLVHGVNSLKAWLFVLGCYLAGV